MTDTVRDRIASILLSGAAQKIDFKLDKIHVDGGGFSFVALALLATPKGNTGLNVAVGNMPAHAAATYNPGTNTYRVPTATYGLQRFERMTLLHESVHALRDANGTRLRLQKGFARPIALSDEAAAYVAGALFDIYDNPASSVTPSFVSGGGVYDCSYAVAMQMVGKTGENVADVFGIGLDNLKSVIKKNPAYAGGLSQPYGNNGVKL